MFVNKLGKAQLKFRRRNVGDAGNLMLNHKNYRMPATAPIDETGLQTGSPRFLKV
jgi:hypothetical protein